MSSSSSSYEWYDPRLLYRVKLTVFVLCLLTTIIVLFMQYLSFFWRGWNYARFATVTVACPQCSEPHEIMDKIKLFERSEKNIRPEDLSDRIPPDVWARQVGQCRHHGSRRPCRPLKQQHGVGNVGRRFAWASMICTNISYVGALYSTVNLFRKPTEFFLFLRLALDFIMAPAKSTNYENSLITIEADSPQPVPENCQSICFWSCVLQYREDPDSDADATPAKREAAHQPTERSIALHKYTKQLHSIGCVCPEHIPPISTRSPRRQEPSGEEHPEADDAIGLVDQRPLASTIAHRVFATPTKQVSVEQVMARAQQCPKGQPSELIWCEKPYIFSDRSNGPGRLWRKVTFARARQHDAENLFSHRPDGSSRLWCKTNLAQARQYDAKNVFSGRLSFHPLMGIYVLPFGVAALEFFAVTLSIGRIVNLGGGVLLAVFWAYPLVHMIASRCVVSCCHPPYDDDSSDAARTFLRSTVINRTWWTIGTVLVALVYVALLVYHFLKGSYVTADLPDAVVRIIGGFFGVSA